MEVRRATASDAPGLLGLWNRLSADGHRADHRYQVADGAEVAMHAAISKWTSGMHPTWVATLDDDLVGMIVTKPGGKHPVLRLPPTLLITDAYVVEPCRRRGVGRQLVDAVRAFARTQGFDRIEVGTLTMDERAVGFWRSLGFGDWRITLSFELPQEAD